MSLVAAYSDSDSDPEDDANEIHAIVPNKIGEVTTNVTISSSILPVTNDEQNQIEDDIKEVELGNTGSSLFSLLPQPKPKKCELVEESDDEFMKKTNFSEKMDIPPPLAETCNEKEEPFKRTSLNLPTPSRKTNKKQPVKITIPSLDEIGDDSDSDDEKSKSNVRNPNKKSTLFSLLPKPRHSVMVGTNKNKVFSLEANRPLIPHTLTKKKEPSLKNKSNHEKKKERKPLVADISGSDDDEDDDIVSSDNFFSLSSKELSNTYNIPGIKSSLPSSKVENNETPGERISVVKEDSIDSTHTLGVDKNVSSVNKKLDNDNKLGNNFFSNLYKCDPNRKTESVKQKTNPINTDTSSASKPKENNAFVTDSTVKHIFTETKHSDVTAPYSDVTAPYSDVASSYSDVTAPYGSMTAPYGAYGNVSGIRPNSTKFSTQRSTGSHEKTYPTSQHFFTYAYNEKQSTQPETVEDSSEVDYHNTPNADLPIDNVALKALQGNKRMKEDINLIDICADDIQAKNTDYLKNLTSESAENQRLKSRNDKDQPTSGQKRKHQITYLAFQAKERELELQQAWSESFATKRQTQSKYGF